MTGIEMIAAERARQIKRGFNDQHDDAHPDGSMLQAAAVHMSTACKFEIGLSEVVWPWDDATFAAKPPVKALTIAGALIAAEIDRLQRAEKAK